MPLSSGQILNNHYRVVKLLAQGGFGTIYRAWDISLNGPCAVKENLDNTPDAQRQFEREAIMLSRLNHPNLPRVRDHFMIPEGQFLVMDYVEGEDLESKRMQAGGALSEIQLLDWMDQICSALTYMHSQTPPIIHRDIKPANIRIASQGKAVLVDFGIAKQQSSGRTTLGAKGHTPGYSPPEQYTGGTTVQSDIYALGATIYTLLTGVLLPESLQRLIPQGGGAPAWVQPPHMVRPGITPKVSQAIMRAIHPDASKRFMTVQDFKMALMGQTPVMTPLPVSPPLYQPPGQTQGQPFVRPSSPANTYTPNKTPPVRISLRWFGIGLGGLAFLVVITAGIYFASHFNVSSAQPVGTPISRSNLTQAAPASTGVNTLTPTTLTGVSPTLTLSSLAISTDQPATDTPVPSATGAAPVPTALANTPDPSSFNGVTISNETSSESGIRVEILYADNTPKVNSWVGIHKQTVDVSNNPLAGERIADSRTNNGGSIFFKLPPDTYSIELGDYVGYLWGNTFNYVVQANTTTVVRVMLGKLAVGLRNATGQPLTDRWIGIYVQDKDLLGNPIRGQRIADGRTNAGGIAIFDLSAGLYTVEIRDIYGEVWGEELNHAILPGKTYQILLTTGKLVVGIVNAEGQPIQNIMVSVYFQRKDVTGNFILGDRFMGAYTGPTGAVSWDVTAGTYGVQIGDLRGYPWGEELNHSIESGKTTTILVELGRLTVGLKDGNGNPISNTPVLLYLERKDAAGNLTKGDRVNGLYTDSAGLAEFDLTPGEYIVGMGDQANSYQVKILSRRTTFFDGNKSELR